MMQFAIYQLVEKINIGTFICCKFKTKHASVCISMATPNHTSTAQEWEAGTLAEWSVSGCQMTDLARTSSPRTRRGSRALQAQKWKNRGMRKSKSTEQVKQESIHSAGVQLHIYNLPKIWIFRSVCCKNTGSCKPSALGPLDCLGRPATYLIQFSDVFISMQWLFQYLQCVKENSV